MNAQVRDNFDAGIPTGSLQYLIRAATTTETLINGAWLECNGVAVSRTTYADLNTILSALSYPFGSGNGSTTFNLPDLQGRSLVAMASGGHTEVNGLGDSDGLAKTSRTPKHNSTHSLLASMPEDYLSQAIGRADIPAGAGINVAASTNPGVTVVTGSIGPGGTRPEDTVPYLVAGIYAVKAL